MENKKELNELINGIFQIGFQAVARFKDGAQSEDLDYFINLLKDDEKFKTAVAEAVKGLDLLKNELENFGWADAAGIAVEVIKMIPQFIELLKLNKVNHG